MLRASIVLGLVMAFAIPPLSSVRAADPPQPTFAQRLKAFFTWKNPFRRKTKPEPPRTFVDQPKAAPRGTSQRQEWRTLNRAVPPKPQAIQQTSHTVPTTKPPVSTPPTRRPTQSKPALPGTSIDGNRVYTGSNKEEESRKRRYFAGRGSTFNESGLPGGAGAARRYAGGTR